MVLSNAERQKRYRERLKAIARGDALGSRVREVLDDALKAVWIISARLGDGSFSDFADVGALKAHMAKEKNPPLDLLRTLLAFIDDADESEARSIGMAVAVLNAALLRSPSDA